MSKFTSRVTKISRRLRWQLRPSSYVPLHWHAGRPNFGDDANPKLFQAIGNIDSAKIRFERQTKPHILGMGSILSKSNSNSVILGSGFIEPQESENFRYLSIVSVRGMLSLQALGSSASTETIQLGDPMVLVNLVQRRPRPDIDIGLVPHESNFLTYKTRYGKRFKVIDPREDPFNTIRSISRCKAVISQSLHGLIVADAMEIPNLWLQPTDNIIGGTFKFMDYFSTVSGEIDCLSIDRLAVEDPPMSSFSIREFKFDKLCLLSRMRETIQNFHR